jgi:hypothetical protein
MIVIPLAGESSRFKKAGIPIPKFMLPLGTGTVLDHVIQSFSAYHQHEDFLFIVREEQPDHLRFVENVARKYHLGRFEIVTVPGGQGMAPDTVAALKKTKLTLYQRILLNPADNIRPGFTMPVSVNRFIVDETKQDAGASYYLASALIFHDAYNAALRPDLPPGRTRERWEAVRLLVNLGVRGFFLQKRPIPESGILYCGTPAQYLETFKQLGGTTFPFHAEDKLLNASGAGAAAFRKTLIDIWADNIALAYGTRGNEKLPETYDKVILGCGREVAKKLPNHALRAYALETLSDRIESQLPLALEIEKLKHGEASDDAAIAKTFYCEDGPQINKLNALIDFLMSPLTPESLTTLAGAKPRGCLLDATSAGHFHASFWARPHREREVFFKGLFSDEAQKPGFKRRVIGAARKPIMDFMPPEKEGSNAFKYAGGFIRVLWPTATNDEMITMLCALMAAVRNDAINPQSDNPDTRFGYRLKDFCVFAGAAKIAQAAHSFAGTSRAWKDGLAGSKSQAAPMSRADYLRKVASLNIPGLDYIGRSLGTGTYIDTKDIVFTNDFLEQHPAMAIQQKTHGLAIQLLKDDAADGSRCAFALAVSVIEILAKHSAEAKKSIGGLAAIIAHKAQMIGEETDLSIVAQKAMIAEKLLNGARLQRGRLRAHFATAGVFMATHDYRIARTILGTHFNDLPAATKTQRKIKSAAAEFIFTSELAVDFSGGPFNHDQHGANQGVRAHGNTLYIGNFDDGAIIMDPPTDDQVKIFANILMDALANSAVNGFAPLSSLKHTFARAQQGADLAGRPQDLHYVNAMVEAVVSLGDYTPHIGPAAYIRALRALYNSAAFDPLIAGIFKKRLDAINDVRKGAGSTEEQARRDLYYPVPAEEDKQFTNRLNRLQGIALLKIGRFLARSRLVGLCVGRTRITLPHNPK